MLSEATGRGRATLVASPEAGVEPAAARSFGAMVRRRVGREPVAYILGRKGFRNIELISDARGLVPRPETELLVEVALAMDPGSVLDVGTGSGAIALALADELPSAELVAVDISPGALELARENAAALGLAERVTFELGSLPSPRHFDLVVANLPYVRDSDRRSLPADITKHEPPIALFGGPDGLDPIRGLLAALNPGSEAAEAGLGCDAIALELGEGQAAAVAALMAAAGFTAVRTERDLAGIERVVVGER